MGIHLVFFLTRRDMASLIWDILGDDWAYFGDVLGWVRDAFGEKFKRVGKKWSFQMRVEVFFQRRAAQHKRV